MTATATAGNATIGQGTVQTGPVTVTGNSHVSDVVVNNVGGSVPAGKAGLGVGVDPETGNIVTENTVTYKGSYKLKNTPDVSIGGPASGPCNGFSGNLGVSMAGIGVSANASTVDPGCAARETARVAAMIGRMDIANAVLEHMKVVEKALKAKVAREAVAAREAATPASAAPPAAPAGSELSLRERQQVASEALQRQATMYKVYDQIKFTDAATQAQEITPQQAMAEEVYRKQAAQAAAEAAKTQAAAQDVIRQASERDATRQATINEAEKQAAAQEAARQAAAEATRQAAAQEAARQAAAEAARQAAAQEAARQAAAEAARQAAAQEAARQAAAEAARQAAAQEAARQAAAEAARQAAAQEAARQAEAQAAPAAKPVGPVAANAPGRPDASTRARTLEALGLDLGKDEPRKAEAPSAADESKDAVTVAQRAPQRRQ